MWPFPFVSAFLHSSPDRQRPLLAALGLSDAAWPTLLLGRCSINRQSHKPSPVIRESSMTVMPFPMAPPSSCFCLHDCLGQRISRKRSGWTMGHLPKIRLRAWCENPANFGPWPRQTCIATCLRRMRTCTAPARSRFWNADKISQMQPGRIGIVRGEIDCFRRSGSSTGQGSLRPA
jgi:hypothetical protein